MLIQHHIKYKEIHGYDEIVLMDKGEHFKLHKKLRLENKCNIPVCVLNKISITAHQRSPKYKKYLEENKQRLKEYRQERYLENKGKLRI